MAKESRHHGFRTSPAPRAGTRKSPRNSDRRWMRWLWLYQELFRIALVVKRYCPFLIPVSPCLPSPSRPPPSSHHQFSHHQPLIRLFRQTEALPAGTLLSPHIRLPSDSASRWTPLSSANSSYCQVCSGLSPPSDSACRAHKEKSLKNVVFSRLF